MARDTVVLNAAAALYMAGVADDLTGGCDAAEGAIADGRANSRLEELIQFSNRTDEIDAAPATSNAVAST